MLAGDEVLVASSCACGSVCDVFLVMPFAVPAEKKQSISHVSELLGEI